MDFLERDFAMSMMESLVGRTPGFELALGLLGLTERDVGRFRDCYVDENLNVVIFTRNGGGNRPDYEDVTNRLRAHPGFIRDYDDEFDCTFAYYVFKSDLPIDRLQGIYEKTTKAVGGGTMDRFHRLMNKLNDENAKDDPEVVRAMAFGKKMTDAIMASIDSSEDGKPQTIIIGDGDVKVS